MVRIIAPDDSTRRLGDVIFTDGVAETDNPATIEYCRSLGWRIEDDARPVVEAHAAVRAGEIEKYPAGNASQETWARWVIEHVDGVDPEQIAELGRDELRDKYGPKAE